MAGSRRGLPADPAVAGAAADDVADDPGFQPDRATLAPPTLIERAQRNIAALDTLAHITERGGEILGVDRDRLALWTGWGALPQLFDPNEDRAPFANLRAQVEQRLSTTELRSAAASTLNAHYTEPAVIDAIWELAVAAGFHGGRVLEPGCGSGLFIGLAPDEIRARSRFVGVEVEPVTARICQAMYPAAEIRPVGFETVRDGDGRFDIAVGNVPFGRYSVFDPVHNPDKLSIHNHFLLKSLALVKPGGLVASVTSRYTLDARNPAARRALYELGDLVAAVRLPNGAHHGVAGTQVVTDVLMFRRRHLGETPQPFDWERTDIVDIDGVGVRVNAWFDTDGPGRVVGELRTGRGMYSDGELMVETPPGGVGAGLRAAVAELSNSVAGIYDPTPPPPPRVSALSTEVVAVVGELGVTASGMLVEHTLDGAVHVTGKDGATTKRLVDLVRLRDIARHVMAAQTAPPDAATVREWDEARGRLNTRYDAYAARWGPINAFRESPTGRRTPEIPKRFRDDPGWGLVSALEVFDPATGRATKAAIFEHWLANPSRRFEGAETAAEALATSLAARRSVDGDYIAELLACDPAAAMSELVDAGLIFRSHTEPDRWEPAVGYLAGDVRSRLRAARTLADGDLRYQPNVAALEAVLPEWLPADVISARLGAVWIPAADIRQFLIETLGANDHIAVEHAAIIGAWSVTAPGISVMSIAATVEWGTSHADAFRLVEDALNLTPTVVYRTNSDGTREKLEAETLAAIDKRAALEHEFAEWVWTDPDRAARLEQVYNDRFNSTALPTWDGSHLAHLPGLSAGFAPHRHQLNAVWRIMASDGDVLLGHRVGAGKTATMVIAGQQLRRTGQITKPLYVVPNHMLDQFASEFRQLYPMANVLVAGKDDLAATARRAFVARCATGEWDAVVMTHSTFGRIAVSPDTERGFIEAELSRFTDAAHAARAAGEKRSVKAIERAAARWNNRLAELIAAPADAGNVAFEQLGVDFVFVDEAHAFKGLPFVTSLPLGSSNSHRATDLVMKLDWLRATYGDKVTTFATGTPVANSLAEMWVLQRFLTPNALRANEMDAFDSWAGTFARAVTRLELAPEGGRFRMHTRIAAFDNVPELLTSFRSFCDLLSDADIPSLLVPDLVGQRPETVVVAGTDDLAELITSLGERADQIRARRVDATVDNMLKVCNDGRLASLDLRMVGRTQDPGTGKLHAAAARITELWQRHRDSLYLDTVGHRSAALGALQAVFCDKGTPTSAGFNAYDELRGLLVDAGMDPARIRFIHEAATDAAKQQMFAACRDGQLDVLIGSTEKMGVGTNIQARLVALHHLDAPWRPADIEQREGRILRHGNQNRAVHVVRYVTEKSFDPYMWQTLERKARFISQVMSPASPSDAARSVEDLDSEVVLSYAEIKAVATGNPLIREQAELSSEVVRLSRLAATHAKAQRALPGRIGALQERSVILEELVVRLDRVVGDLVGTRGDQFVYRTIDSRRLTDRVDAGEALRDLIGGVGRVSDGWQPAGRLGGVALEYDRRRGFDSTACVVRVAGDTDSIEWATADLWNSSSHVIMTRLERHLERIPERLSKARNDLGVAREQIERAQRTLGQPFAHQQRLAGLVTQLDDLNTAVAATIDPATPDQPATSVADSLPAEPPGPHQRPSTRLDSLSL